MAIELKSDLNVSGSLTVNGGPVGGPASEWSSNILGTPDHVLTRQSDETAYPVIDYHVSGSGNHIVYMEDYQGPISGFPEYRLHLHIDTWDNGAQFSIVYGAESSVEYGTGVPFVVKWRVECSPTTQWGTYNTTAWDPSTYAGYSTSRTTAKQRRSYLSSTAYAHAIKSSNGFVQFGYLPYQLMGYYSYYQTGPQSAF